MYVKSNPTTVAEAALLLDRNIPEWYTRVNLSRLDMGEHGNMVNCVLGQVNGGAAEELAKQILQNPFSDQHLWYGRDKPFGFSSSDKLQTAWVKEIQARRLDPEDYNRIQED